MDFKDCLKWVSIFVFMLGTIGGFVSASTERINEYGHTVDEFSWSIFIGAIFVSFILSLFIWAIKEILERMDWIHNDLNYIKHNLEKKDK